MAGHLRSDLLLELCTMRILVVDDEVKLAERLAEGLTKSGYSVDTAHDGSMAFKRISMYQDEYNLIILDLMLPFMSGYDICRQMRAQQITVPILVLTAKGDTDDKAELLFAGADDYIVKPFSFAELVARVQAIIRRPRNSIAPTLRVLDIELSSSERTASRDGVPLSLTLKEFSLLEYFLLHPNQVVNREDLIAHIWDFEYESFSNVIDVHIKNLRQKLDYDENTSILETIRGIGYRLKTAV